MPALFERHAHTPARRHHRPTVIVSGALHAAALLVLIVAQLGAAFDGLEVNQRLQMMAIPAPPPPPPAVEAPRPVPRQSPTANPQAAPVDANAIVLDVPPPAPAAPGPVAPGALPVDGPGTGLPGQGRGSNGVTLAPAPQAPTDPVRPGGDILVPTRTRFVPPSYPEVARTARIDGTVILEAVIDERGDVRDVRVLRSIPLLDRAAIDAVREWRYTPTRLNGVPVAVVMTVTVTFTLR